MRPTDKPRRRLLAIVALFCTFAVFAIAGLRINYGYSGGPGLSVLGEPDRTYPLWTVFFKGEKSFSADQVTVLVAWY